MTYVAGATRNDDLTTRCRSSTQYLGLGVRMASLSFSTTVPCPFIITAHHHHGQSPRPSETTNRGHCRALFPTVLHATIATPHLLTPPTLPFPSLSHYPHPYPHPP